jgi:hypothetical protein
MTQYDFRLSLRSNDPKVVFTGKYLNQFDDMRHRVLSRMVDAEYPIALCLDPTKTDDEVLLALIESLSNDLARSAYKVNFIRASRGVNITPDDLSSFGLLPSIQYASGEAIVGGASPLENRIPGQLLDYGTPEEVAQVIVDVCNSPDRLFSEDEDIEERKEDNSEEQGLSEEDLDNMTDEEYTIAMAGVIERPVMKS